MKELALFRRLAVYGVHDKNFVCFRRVDGSYGVYDKDDLSFLFTINEGEAYNTFYKWREAAAKFTFLDSPFRKAA